MKIIRVLVTASAGASLAMALVGTAAASSVATDTTGPGSTQVVKVDNRSSVDTSNTSNVSLKNENVQAATTGNVSADRNTTVGGLGSGDAHNNNQTVSTVAVANNSQASVPSVPVGGSGSVAGVSAAAAQPVGGRGAGVPVASVGGMGAGAPATLPVTGPSTPIDVSAMRAGWHTAVTAPTTALVKQTSGITGGILMLATLLSLAGAAGSVLYGQRKQVRA